MNVASPGTETVSVLARSALSRSALLLRLLGSDNLHWLPGQYVEVAPPRAPQQVSFYSIASAPDPRFPGHFELAMSLSASAELLEQLEPGRTLVVSAPRGTFVWEPGPGATLLVGIGTGVAPLRAMLQAALRSSSAAVTLLLGARSEEDLLFRDELGALAERDARFRFEPTLSRADGRWPSARGRVQDHLPRIVAALDPARIFICGTRTMVADSVACLDRLGVARARVSSESHGP